MAPTPSARSLARDDRADFGAHFREPAVDEHAAHEVRAGRVADEPTHAARELEARHIPESLRPNHCDNAVVELFEGNWEPGTGNGERKLRAATRFELMLMADGW